MIEENELLEKLLNYDDNFLLECVKKSENLAIHFIVKNFSTNPKIKLNDDFKYNDKFRIQLIKQRTSYIIYLLENLKNDLEFYKLVSNL